LGTEARAAAAGRSWSLVARLGSGVEARAAAAVKSGRLDLGTESRAAAAVHS
jgi:hypothetical protein